MILIKEPAPGCERPVRIHYFNRAAVRNTKLLFIIRSNEPDIPFRQSFRLPEASPANSRFQAGFQHTERHSFCPQPVKSCDLHCQDSGRSHGIFNGTAVQVFSGNISIILFLITGFIIKCKIIAFLNFLQVQKRFIINQESCFRFPLFFTHFCPPFSNSILKRGLPSFSVSSNTEAL